MQRHSSVTAVAFLSVLVAAAGCEPSPEVLAGKARSPSKEFSLILIHTSEAGTFPILKIIQGPSPAVREPHVTVRISPDEVEGIIAALDECNAMARQDVMPPGRAPHGWTMQLYLRREDGARAHGYGYWHLGREPDINLPGSSRDIFQAMRESLVGQARKQVDGYCALVGRRADAFAKAATAPAVEFVVQSHWAHGRVSLNVIAKDAGLEIGWVLPPEITGRIKTYIRAAEDSPTVRLFQGSDVASYLAPGGIRLPREHEDALAGTLICEPKAGKTVSITLRGILFPSRRIEHIGPLDVQLDVPAPT